MLLRTILALLLMVAPASAQFIFGGGSGGGGGGTGTVTTLSVVTANGFAGTVANPTTTPAITLTTSVTGSVCSNGTALSACTTTGTGSTVLAASPTLVTPALGVATATSLAIGGATLGTNALAVTGTANISTSVTTPIVAASGVSFLNEIYFESGKTKQGILGDDANTGLTFTGGGTGVRAASLGPTVANASSVFAFQLRADSLFTWNSTTDTRPTLGFDTSLSRNAAGVIQFGTIAANASGSWLATNGTLSGTLDTTGPARISHGYTVATLPAAGTAGRQAYVTDQLTVCAAAGAALTGGGAVVCPTFDNGVAWVGGFLLKRDLAPAANDNTPAFINVAA